MMRWSFAAACAAVFLLSSSAAAITIRFEPPTQTIAIGTPLDVDLLIEDLGDGTAPSLIQYQAVRWVPTISGYS